MISIAVLIVGCICLIVLRFFVLAKVVKPAIDSLIRLRFDNEFNRRFENEWEQKTRVINFFLPVQITGLRKNKVRDGKYAEYWQKEAPKYRKGYYRKAEVYSIGVTVFLAISMAITVLLPKIA
jgi:hypothetical protein